MSPTKVESLIAPPATALVAICVGLFTGGCLSLGSSPHISQRVCATPPSTVGLWKWSKVDTQLGPSSWSLAIHCDCTYDAKLRVMNRLVRVKERGDLVESHSQLDLGRANGERTIYDFRLKKGPNGPLLKIVDETGEINLFHQKTEFTCGPQRAAPDLSSRNPRPPKSAALAPTPEPKTRRLSPLRGSWPEMPGKGTHSV